MSIRVRPATLEDLPVLVEFNRNLAWETEHKKLEDAVLIPGVRAIFSDPSKGFYLVAADESRVVGQLMITYEWSDWRNGWFWWLQSVYVHRDYRRQGIFRTLFQEAESLAKKQANVVGFRLYVERDNERGQSTYNRLGMVNIPFLLFQKVDDFIK
jgi:GNAT superfamily N-acetyltransferase